VTGIPADPFERGRAAFRLGVPRESIPYPKGAEGDRWNEGWDAGHDATHPRRRMS
jgi:hypothetical protein